MIGFTRLRRWWQRERLIDTLLDQVAQGHGSSHRCFARGSAVAAMLAWVDDQLATSRTPYGFSAVQIVLLEPEGTPVHTLTLARRHEWQNAQAAWVAVVEPLLVARDVTVAVLAFGTMLNAAATAHDPVSEKSE